MTVCADTAVVDVSIRFNRCNNRNRAASHKSQIHTCPDARIGQVRILLLQLQLLLLLLLPCNVLVVFVDRAAILVVAVAANDDVVAIFESLLLLLQLLLLMVAVVAHTVLLLFLVAVVVFDSNTSKDIGEFKTIVEHPSPSNTTILLVSPSEGSIIYAKMIDDDCLVQIYVHYWMMFLSLMVCTEARAWLVVVP
jgi:hypothetical protein